MCLHPVTPSCSSYADKHACQVQILEQTEDYQYAGDFHVTRARLRYRRFDGQMSDPVTRISFDRGDSVGVLLHDPQCDAVVLVRQFRYPVYVSLAAPGGHVATANEDCVRQAWTLEIVAGVQEKGRSAVEVACAESLEEAGYRIRSQLSRIAEIYPSPGGSSERITLFMAEIDQTSPVARGGGILAEGENTQVVAVPLDEAIAMIGRGEIQDAKTIIALQYLAMRR